MEAVTETEMDCSIQAPPTSAKSDSDSHAVSSVQTNQETIKSEPENASSEGITADRTTESPTTAENSTTWNSIKCVYCNQVLASNDEPKLLECLHSACAACVKSKINEQSQSDVENVNNPKNATGPLKGLPVIACAVCRIVCRQSQIIDNQFLIETANDESTSNESNKNEDQKCNSCADNETATSWCVECSEFICNKCVQAHKRLKITKDHTIKSREEALQENQSISGNKNMICPVHHNEQLTLFCENCDILTCRDCQLTDHRDHKYKFTHEIASETKTFIAGMLKDVSYKRVLLDSAMKVIDDRQNLISEKKQTLVKEITQMVVKLTNTINIRGKELVHRLNEVCDNKQKTLNEKKIALEQLSQLTDHCIEFVQSALNKGSDMAILFSKRHVTNHLQRIKCRRADIPNPEIPVRIHLALDKVPDLIKVLSSIGAIVVDGKVYPPSTTGPGPNSNNNTNNNTPATSPVQRPVQQSTSPLILPRMPPPYPQQQHSSPVMVSQAVHIQPARQGPPLQRPQTSLIRHQPPGQMLRMPGSSHHQVSSSTHPQASLNMGDSRINPQLRGLLQSNGQPVYVQTAPGVYQAVQPSYVGQAQYNSQPRFMHQQMPNYAQQSQSRILAQNQTISQNRPIMPRPSVQPMMGQGYHPPQQQQQQQTQQQQPQQQQQQQHQPPPPPPPPHILQQAAAAAKWHIPQNIETHPQEQHSGPNRPPPSLISPDDSFKITLKPRTTENKSTVTSTNPKTPSPSLGKGDDTERNLDKYCEDSVNDLMATIAKLDSNGVQVLAEGRGKTGGSPHVDSSTDENISVAGSSKGIMKSQMGDTDKDDPNEDWCAVCMDGGELVCCDKCPKVFHQNCHIPPLSVEESDTWQCLLCMNFADIPDNALGERRDSGLSPREKKIAERLILELYCQYEPSLHFREIVGPEHTYYHSVIKRPISLELIKQKVNWNSENHYTNLEQLIKDVRLLFRNAYVYNPEESNVYKDGKTLEAFFDQQLEKWLPAYAYETFCDDEEDVSPPNKKYRRIIAD